MDGLQDEEKQVDEGAAQEPQGAPTQVTYNFLRTLTAE